MDEASARDVVLVEAVESADDARTLWSDADRIEAGRVAARELGQSATFESWLARRAAIALARLGPETPAIDRLAHARWSWTTVTAISLVVAFIIGLGAARIGPSQRINLLAPPLAALLAWNVVVYLLLASLQVRRWFGPRRDTSHRLRSCIAKLASLTSTTWRRTVRSSPLAAAAASFTVKWTRLCFPQGERRAACLLHVGAALLASGAIAGLYVRGLALEYRAVWQSTFLDAQAVASMLHVVLAPGALVTGLAIPGAADLARLGPVGPGENAARWIHLYAGTLAVVVIAPRLALAALAWAGTLRAARRFPLNLDTPYYQRLARAWRTGPLRIRVMPYSYEVSARSRTGLEAALARALETPVDLTWATPARYGDDPPPGESDAAAPGIALFNLSSTPELENHVAFAEALGGGAQAPARVIVIVDTSEFVSRFHAQPARLVERTSAWRDAFHTAAIAPIFIQLSAPDLAADAGALAAAFEAAP